MRSSRRTLPVLAVLMAASLVAACQSSPTSDPTTDASSPTDASPDPGSTDPAPPVEEVEIRITWWGADSRNNATLAALDLYMAKNPHVKITPEYSPFSGYFDKIATLTAAGDAPDIMQFQYSFFPAYVANGQLLDLGTQPGLDLSALDEGVSLQGVVDGKRYAIPAGANTQAVIFDPAIFAAADVAVPAFDWTWDDYRQVCQELVDSGEITYCSNDFSHSDQLFDFWLTQHGKAFYTSDGELGFTAADLVEYWTFFDEMRADKLLPPADVTAGTTGDVATYPIVTGEAAMDFAFSTLLPGVASTAGKELELLPFPSGGTQPAQYLIGTGITWTISANSKHPEVAADILNFLLNDPEALQALSLERGVPVTADGRTIVTSIVTPEQAAMVGFIDQVAQGPLATESVFFNDPPQGAAEITGLFKEATQTVSYGQAGIETAAEAFIQEATDALSRAG